MPGTVVAAPAKNEHKVYAKQWRKWDGRQRRMFNTVYEDIYAMGAELFCPDDLKPTDEQFLVIAHNTAWTAANDLLWVV